MLTKTPCVLAVLATSFSFALAQEVPRAAPPPRGPERLDVLAAGADWPARNHCRNAVVATAVATGVDWLQRCQRQDGRWDADNFGGGDLDDATIGRGRPTHDIAATGLALFALLREGAPPADAVERKALLRAAAWLRGQQGARGRLGPATTHDFVYDHAIGTIGLLAAAAVLDDDDSKKAGEDAVRYLEQHRNPFMVWRYQPRDGDNDTSVTTWCTLACSAANAHGIAVDPTVFDSVRGWIGAVTGDDGRVGYSRAGEPSSRLVGTHAMEFPPAAVETLTAAGLLCLELLPTPPAEEATTAARRAKSIERLAKRAPQWQREGGGIDFFGWFFATEALRKGPEAVRTTWQQALVTALATGQEKDGPHAGSWPPVDAWGKEGGRICTTALAILALQGCY